MNLKLCILMTLNYELINIIPYYDIFTKDLILILLIFGNYLIVLNIEEYKWREFYLTKID